LPAKIALRVWQVFPKRLGFADPKELSDQNDSYKEKKTGNGKHALPPGLVGVDTDDGK
jgi:hypothetical protein